MNKLLSIKVNRFDWDELSVLAHVFGSLSVQRMQFFQEIVRTEHIGGSEYDFYVSSAIVVLLGEQVGHFHLPVGHAPDDEDYEGRLGRVCAAVVLLVVLRGPRID